MRDNKLNGHQTAEVKHKEGRGLLGLALSKNDSAPLTTRYSLLTTTASGTLALLLLTFCLSGNIFAQNYWARTYAFDNNWENTITWSDEAYSIQQTSDGGFIVGGRTEKNDLFDRQYATLILKLDSFGNIEWWKDIKDMDMYGDILQTSDGGYIVGGGNWFSSTTRGWWQILKLDKFGNIEWQKKYDAMTYQEYPYIYGAPTSFSQTTDGGYIVAGQVFDGFYIDVWVVKLDSSGNIQWQKLYEDGQRFPVIRQTRDGGFVLTGDNYFHDGIEYHSNFRILKLDAEGNSVWAKRYDSIASTNKHSDVSRDIQQTSDGGFIIVGYTDASTILIGRSVDIWIVKTDAEGNVEWAKLFWSNEWESATSVQQTSDGGYIIAVVRIGVSDGALLRLDSSGNIQWYKTYGGANGGRPTAVQLTSDGGYIMTTDSFGYSDGSFDMWILKLDPNGNIDPSCGFIKDASLTAEDALPEFVGDGLMESVNTNAIVADINVQPMGLTPMLQVQCYQSCPSAGGCVPAGSKKKYPTDINCDGCTDELIEFSYSFGSRCLGDTWHNADADFNNDGIVDGSDLSIFVNDFGAGCF